MKERKEIKNKILYVFRGIIYWRKSISLNKKENLRAEIIGICLTWNQIFYRWKPNAARWIQKMFKTLQYQSHIVSYHEARITSISEGKRIWFIQLVLPMFKDFKKKDQDYT